jgi:hypothetical protein
VFQSSTLGQDITEHSTFHMMEVETISEMLDADTILTQLVIQEDIIGFKPEVINY